MVFKRTLHPVGHGAFFTEQFIDSRNSIWFHVAYDCGSFTKESLYREIENIDRFFDFMFISHFDSDHVNGLKRLIEKGLINKKTKIVIPFIYPDLIKILLPEMKTEMSRDTFDSVEAMFNSGAEIIGLDDNLMINARYNEYQYDIRANNDYHNQHIHGFTKFRLNHRTNDETCWYYMPFNTIQDDGRKERFLKELQKNEQINKFINIKIMFDREYNDEDSIVTHLLKESNGINGEYSKIGISFCKYLKDLYKKASPAIKGVTAINVNSLNLLSFGSNSLKKESNHILKYSKGNYALIEKKHSFFQRNDKNKDIYKKFMNEIISKDYYISNIPLLSFSVLYTGDCMMEDYFFKCIDIILNHVINSQLGLVQIPHHGSMNNYNREILSKPIFSSFINFSNTKKTCADIKEIEKDFFKIARPCFEITQDDESRFEQYVFWEESLFER